MAYIGLFNMVMSKMTDGVYTNGFSVGKAVSLSITPEYEANNEYSDINDLEYKQEFLYASVEIKVTDKNSMIIGKEDDDIVFYDTDETDWYGLGFVRPTSNGRYEAMWLYKVSLVEMEESQDTRGESIEYATPGYSGRAVPDNNGRWKRVARFETKDNAIAFLKEMANMQ